MSNTPKGYSGSAVRTTMSTTINSSDLVFGLVDSTGWPSANFVTTLSIGTSAEEKVLCSSRVGLTVNIVPGGRGYDGTTAQAHTNGDDARHTIAAVDLAEANDAVVNTIGRVTTKGDLLAGTGAGALGRLGAGTNGLPVQADSAQTLGVKYGSLAQAVTHDTPDTDAAAGSLHHTVGVGATQAAAGNHVHDGSTTSSQTVPSGVINPFAGAAAPGGWLLCDGSAVSRATYANLFGVCGTTYGAGDGSTTFNVPNLKGRVAVGVDAGQAEFNARGVTGGVKQQVITEPNLPPHAHTIDHDHASFNTASAGQHAHDAVFTQNLGAANNDPGTIRVGANSGQYTGTVQGTVGTGAHLHAIDVPAFSGTSGNGLGSTSPFYVLDPYLAVNHIIKT